MAVIKDIVLALNDDQGISEQMYLAIRRLVELELGTKAASVLAQHIAATEGRFYLKGTVSPEECWEAVYAEAGVRLQIVDSEDPQDSFVVEAKSMTEALHEGLKEAGFDWYEAGQEPDEPEDA